MALDLFYTDEQRAFAGDVRAWVRANLDPHVREKMLANGAVGVDELVPWWRQLNARGWGAPAFPVEHGGTDWDVMKRGIFADVLMEEGAPRPNVHALDMIGPVLIEFGTDAQKAAILPRLVNADDLWAQGFSEPGAGSDLASLKTRAEDKGDHWLVNGQKLWTSFAHYSNKIFLLARTNPEGKPQAGISMLLADIDLPGITIRPVLTIERAHEVNEVFFDDVKIPKENIVGAPGQGWTIAKFLLGNERVGIAQIGKLKRLLGNVKRAAAASPDGKGGTMLDDRRLRDELAVIESDMIGIEISNLRMLMAETIGAEPSLLKLRSSELEQRLYELAMIAGGPLAVPIDETAREHPAGYEGVVPNFAASLAAEYYRARAATIYGGTSEVQHNIVAKSTLGL